MYFRAVLDNVALIPVPEGGGDGNASNIDTDPITSRPAFGKVGLMMAYSTPVPLTRTVFEAIDLITAASDSLRRQLSSVKKPVSGMVT
jgi:hypothetical protein